MQNVQYLCVYNLFFALPLPSPYAGCYTLRDSMIVSTCSSQPFSIEVKRQGLFSILVCVLRDITACNVSIINILFSPQLISLVMDTPCPGSAAVSIVLYTCSLGVHRITTMVIACCSIHFNPHKVSPLHLVGEIFPSCSVRVLFFPCKFKNGP